MLGRMRLVVIAAVAVASVSCWHHHPPNESAGGGPATLRVDNRNWQNVDIQVLHRGMQSHLASVNATAVTNVVFPKYLLSDLGEVQLIAHAIGTPYTITTQVIVLKPGTEVRWTLETDLNRSTIAVY
ncbi:MAG TPA: hypothetical protein VFW04_04595 [Gemmatimonadaceae bacterium]|nr:hypothetical protein [Gemmatimonadaceae bacterium]